MSARDVVALWSRLSAVDFDRAWSVMEDSDEVQRLARHPYAALEAAAVDALRDHENPMLRLSLVRWLAALGDRTPTRAPAGRSRAPRKQGATRELPANRPDALRSLLAEVQHPATFERVRHDFPAETVIAAIGLLQARGWEQIRSGRALRREPTWTRPPSPSLAGAPVLRADDEELAVLALLSAKPGKWMFVSNPAGRMFTHAHSGRSEEGERFYVDGLCTLVDTASGLISSHRASCGGRVYFTARWIQCAECDRVMAWIGSVGTRAVAFKVCPSVPVHKLR